MAYSTATDLKDALTNEKLRQLTDDESLGTVFQGRLDKAISDADALIDSYLCGRYTVPISPVPLVVRRLSVDFSIYFLYKRRREFEMPEDLGKEYDRNVRYLEGVRDGKTHLDTPSMESYPSRVFRSNKTSSSRVFTPSALDRY